MAKFTPPTIEEVNAQIAEQGYMNITAENFISFYAMGGWKISEKKKMVDWKIALGRADKWTDSKTKPSDWRPECRRVCFVDQQPATIEVVRNGKVRHICDKCAELLKSAPPTKTRNGKIMPKKYMNWQALEIMIQNQKAANRR